MIPELPTYVSILFGFTTLFTLYIFIRASHYSKVTTGLLCGWTLLQGMIAFTGFYTVTQTLPPRFALLIAPALLFILGLFVVPGGRKYLSSLRISHLTLLHTIRIPVEFVLYGLYLHHRIPEVMTFEGRNLDILSGITAPFIYYFGFIKPVLSRKIILAWNWICLGLLINIVIHAILAAPTPFQQIDFDQPNVGVFYFPFAWLPGVVVPLVLLSHLAAIRQLNSSGGSVQS